MSGFVQIRREVKRVARREGITISTREAELVARTVLVQRQLVADGDAGGNTLGHADQTGEVAISHYLQIITTNIR